MRTPTLLAPPVRAASLARGCAVVLAAAALLAAGGAHALDELRLDPPPAGKVPVGAPVDLGLALEFDDVTLGGGVSVSYDAAVLDLVSVSFDASLPDDPDFRCPTAGLPTSVPCPPSAAFLSFGTLAGLPTGVAVPVATLHFLAVGAGASDVLLAVANAFSDPVGSPLAVSLVGTRVAVPEPAAGLLLLAPLAALVARGGRRRRR